MKTTSLALLASTACATLAFAVESDPATQQYQVYPKNLARQHVGSNLFVFNPTTQTYVPTEASAAWLDDDITTGWPVLAGKQHYLLALAEPELVSNFSVSSRPADGTISISAGDEPAAPGARSWASLAQNIPFNSVNDQKLAKPFTRFAKYLLIETDLANPGPLYSLYVYGEKPATIYSMREREQPIDSHAIFGQYINNQTTFNANGLYANGTVAYANSPDGSTSWQKAIDDNPESGVALVGSASEPSAVIQYASPQSVSRVALLTDGLGKGKLEFFAIDEGTAAGTATTTSLEGRTPTVSLVLDGSTPRSSIDFPAVSATKLAVRWSPVVPSEPLNVREIESFSTASLDNYEVGMKADAVAAYDTTGADYLADGKDMKDPKDPKDPADPVAAGPAGGPYLPGALGFPPNLSGRRVRFLSQ